MINKFLVFIIAAFALSCSGQKHRSSVDVKEAHNALSSLDWDGSYKGTLPAADGEGIETLVILRSNNTYSYFSKHIGHEETKLRVDGKFEWVSGFVIKLNKNDVGTQNYFVSEGALYHLDIAGDRIEGDIAPHYRLQKSAATLVGRRWQLTELQGKAVKPAQELSNTVDLYFDPAQNRLSGSAGCNRFNGLYTLDGSKLTFGNAATTMMACPDMTTENEFLKMLPTVVRYDLAGDVVVFRDSNDKVVARFTEVM